jgi:hypothetical protein
VEAIDGMLAGLHRLRSGLLSQIRQADDATDARVDALLAQCGAPSPGLACHLWVRGDRSQT